jgi:hypothetical protein
MAESNDDTSLQSEYNATPPPSPPPHADFIWQWLLHEDDHLTNRVNFFLIGESMLVSAYATLLSSSKTNIGGATYIVALCGILIAGMWWRVSTWALHGTIYRLKNAARTYIPFYDEIAHGRRTRLPAHRLIAQVLPCAIMIMWVALMASAWYTQDRVAEPAKGQSHSSTATVAPASRPDTRGASR